MINAQRVHEILLDCLFKDKEFVDNRPIMTPVVVKGIMANYGFHPERIKTYEKEIVEMLNQLPLEFHENSGGGMSFLNMCMTRDGEQWTGMQKVMEELVLLGMGIGRVAFCAPRELWSVLPGGMPYIVVRNGIKNIPKNRFDIARKAI